MHDAAFEGSVADRRDEDALLMGASCLGGASFCESGRRVSGERVLLLDDGCLANGWRTKCRHEKSEAASLEYLL